jgi:hypothetical protein
MLLNAQITLSNHQTALAAGTKAQMPLAELTTLLQTPYSYILGLCPRLRWGLAVLPRPFVGR